MVTASVNVGAHKEQCVFYVTSTKESAHDIIIRHAWMHKHRCEFNWEDRNIDLTFGTQRTNIPATIDAIITTTIPCANLVVPARLALEQEQ